MSLRPRSVPSAERRIPGEEGVWVFILGDMTVFATLFGVIVYTRGQDPALFRASQAQLSTGLGAINTLLLLTSSLLVALGVRTVDGRREGRAPLLFGAALLCAAAFAGIKGIEYTHLIGSGFTVTRNDFFTYYFASTGLHLVHVVIGSGVLAWVIRLSRRAHLSHREVSLVECGTSYWHMVDLLWVVLFPLLYLVH